MIKTILDLNLNFDHLSNYKQEDYLEYKILECLQKTQQSLTRLGIREYIISHDPYLINAELKNINIRLSFALNSLSKGKFIYHPKRGLTALTALGKHISLSNHEYIHQQVLEGLDETSQNKA